MTYPIVTLVCLLIIVACFGLKVLSRVLGVGFGLLALMCLLDAGSIVLRGHELVSPARPHGQSPIPSVLWFVLFLCLAIGFLFFLPRRLKKRVG